ncbi:hypothetical protein M601_019900 [Cellulophaga baltica 4]|nr:hypothetical protein M601_019900 [Cellulophaga baltica 4]
MKWLKMSMLLIMEWYMFLKNMPDSLDLGTGENGTHGLFILTKNTVNIYFALNTNGGLKSRIILRDGNMMQVFITM